MDNQNSSNKLYIYPNINASYKVVGDLMIFYAGPREFSSKFLPRFCKWKRVLSPIKYIPTDKQYEIFAGLKKLASNVATTLKVHTD
jgi:hypothetical protein